MELEGKGLKILAAKSAELERSLRQKQYERAKGEMQRPIKEKTPTQGPMIEVENTTVCL